MCVIIFIRLEIILRLVSQDPCVAQVALTLKTGSAVQQAKSSLRHRDIIGHGQQGRGGFGFGESRPFWHNATPFQCRKLVVEEVRR